MIEKEHVHESGDLVEWPPLLGELMDMQRAGIGQLLHIQAQCWHHTAGVLWHRKHEALQEQPGTVNMEWQDCDSRLQGR